MTQPAVTVPAGPTSCARRRLAREGSAYPARRGVHTLHTVSLFRPSPKVAMNPLWVQSYKRLCWGIVRRCVAYSTTARAVRFTPPGVRMSEALQDVSDSLDR